MANTNSNKQKGYIFYMRERHYLKVLGLNIVTNIVGHAKKTDGTIDPLCFKKFVEDVQNLEIDLKDNFKHWGVVIDSEREDVLRLGNSISLVFFTTDKMDSFVFLGNNNNPNLEQMKKEDSFNEIIEIITQFKNSYTQVDLQKQ
jgi:hypothetical protein